MKNELNKAHIAVDRQDGKICLCFFSDGTSSYLDPKPLTPFQARELAVALIQASDETWEWDAPETVEY